MRILVATDAFPPVCGGSGWSTYELTNGLRALGHDLLIVQPRPGQSSDRRTTYDDFTVREIGIPAPNVPYVRNYFKNERLYGRLGRRLAALARAERIDVIHAQHVLTGPPSIAAARAAGIPVVCTVRDYWPVCYWSTLIYDFSSDDLCPACSPTMMSRCVRPRAGAAWPLALPMIPYMRGNLARKRRALARADAVIAVSSTIAHDLATRAPELIDVRMEVIPNPVDVAGLRAAADRAERPEMPVPYAIFVGKLAQNKGVSKLLAVVDRAGLRWPLVVVGDGPERARLEEDARRLGRPVRFTGWLAREEALRWLRHASLLIFPSHGPESLSRVLLEAAALGVPTAAMETGGTGDIITHDVTGLLSHSTEELARDVSRLIADEGLRRRLAAAAHRAVDATFDQHVVIPRIEALYRTVASDRSRRPHG